MNAPPEAHNTGAMNMIAALLEQRAGQQIAVNRAWRIETALGPILRERGLGTLEELVAQLLAKRTGALVDQVVDALLNQETSFFRDAAVLDAVGEAALDLRSRVESRRLRIWSAGCSTGQEPLSLAMLFDELGLNDGPLAPEIVATDISPVALNRARAGRYSQFEIQRGLPVRRMMSWFDCADGDWTARPELVRRVHFRQHNLAQDSAPPGKFDIILCRNVLLYFAPDMRRTVFDTLFSAIRPGGLLVLGAGETVIGQTGHFTPSEQYRGFYRAAIPSLAGLRTSAG